MFLDCSLRRLDDEGSTKNFRAFVRYILDPKVIILDSGCIYLMRIEPIQVMMASYGHDVHVMHVMTPMLHIRLTILSITLIRRNEEWQFTMVRLRGGVSQLNL